MGGMHTKTFSSGRERLSNAASVGLGTILQDQKTTAGSSRSIVLLGLSLQTTSASACCLSNSPVCALTAYPVESSGVLDADDFSDGQKVEHICVADTRESRNSQPPKEHLRHARSATLGFDLWNHGYDPAFQCDVSHAQTHTQIQTRAHQGTPLQEIHTADVTQPGRHHVVDKGLGCFDAITTTASVSVAPLSKISDSRSTHASARKALTPSWTIPGAGRRTSYDATRHSKHQSVPMDVPTWPKILEQQASKANGTDGRREVAEEDFDRLPPHELLAKEYGESEVLTASVCEGLGRTLKGRDMWRVRNAVWSQIGFAD